jgi:hypothetical protein
LSDGARSKLDIVNQAGPDNGAGTAGIGNLDARKSDCGMGRAFCSDSGGWNGVAGAVR